MQWKTVIIDNCKCRRNETLQICVWCKCNETLWFQLIPVADRMKKCKFKYLFNAVKIVALLASYATTSKGIVNVKRIKCSE